jgi:hypothetical protein
MRNAICTTILAGIDDMPITACMMYMYFGIKSKNTTISRILTVDFTSHACFFTILITLECTFCISQEPSHNESTKFSDNIKYLHSIPYFAAHKESVQEMQIIQAGKAKKSGASKANRCNPRATRPMKPALMLLNQRNLRLVYSTNETCTHATQPTKPAPGLLDQ